MKVVVKFIAPDGNPGIAKFEAGVKGGSPGQNCSVETALVELDCTISTLHPAREYLITARACLPNSEGCSAAIEKEIWTMPPGTLTYFEELYYLSVKHLTFVVLNNSPSSNRM